MTTFSDKRNRVAALLSAGLVLASSACGGASSSTPVGQCKEVPPTPVNLTATAHSSSQIDLSWSASAVTDSNCKVTYQVLHGTQLIATSISDTSYSDKGLTPHTSYAYTVQAVDAAGISGPSNEATAMTQALPDTTPPSAPTGLASSGVASTSFTLSWSASTDDVGVTGYLVYRGGTTEVASVATTSTPISGLTPSTSYSFTVKALDAAGNASAASSALTVTTLSAGGGGGGGVIGGGGGGGGGAIGGGGGTLADTTAPSAPSSLGYTNLTAVSVTLSWSASTDNVGVAGYDVYSSGSKQGSATTTSITLVTLTPATTYVFTVKARDAAGNVSSASSPVSVTTPALPDTTPPSAPSGLTVTGTTTTSVSLSWTASTDNVAVTGYRVFQGSTQVATSATTSVTVGSLSASTQYTFSVEAYDQAGNVSSASASVLATTATPVDTTPPSVPSNLAASSVTSSSVTLSWSASTDASGVTGYQVLVGGTAKATTTTTSYTVSGLSPGTTYSFTVKAYDPAGNYSSASSAVSATTATVSTADVTLTIDASSNRKAISPLIYGYNANTVSGSPAGTSFLRLGGNRWTTYNWTNNWSNAGFDWGPYESDTYLGDATNGPGYAITPTIDDAKSNGIPALVTIPIQGYVAQPKLGVVPLTSALSTWFFPNVPAKGSAFTLTPSSTSTTVYQDELANFVANRWGSSTTPHFALDNEPDLWGYVDSNGAGQGTHPEVQRTQITYAGLLQQSIASASAIKSAVPNGLIYGPVVHGWNGFLNLQGAIDADGSSIDQSFIDYYLANMAAASTSKRLLDVLDVHWYPEAKSSCTGSTDNNVQIINTSNSDCVVAARVQAPRSLFDANYVENSWITQWTTPGTSMGTGIQLIPRFQAKINAKYPGTKFAITAYNYGGEDHPSGAIAQADVLGIFGSQGLYAASNWQLNTSHAWSFAAWKAYRNYDGSGHNFGDTSVSASTTDLSHVSVYASVDSTNANRMVLVVIHRPTLSSSGSLDTKSRTVQINWNASSTLGTAKAYQLTSGSTPTWTAVSVPAPSGNSMTVTLPAMSVTTIELTP